MSKFQEIKKVYLSLSFIFLFLNSKVEEFDSTLNTTNTFIPDSAKLVLQMKEKFAVKPQKIRLEVTITDAEYAIRPTRTTEEMRVEVRRGITVHHLFRVNDFEEK